MAPTHIVRFTKHHTRGALKGLTSPDQTVSFPNKKAAEAWAAKARTAKDLSDVRVEKVEG